MATPVQPRLSVLICAPETTDHVFSSVELVRRSTFSDVEIVVLCGDAIRPDLVPRLQAIWAGGRVNCLASAGDSVPALRNAGLRASSGTWAMFLEEGDTIDPAYIEQVLDAVAAGDVDVVTSWGHFP